MKNIIVGKRYAKALLDLALERESLEKTREDMESILQVFNSSREFRLLMNNPVVSSSKKYAVVKLIFASHISQDTLLYFKILVQKRREMNIGLIAGEFLNLYKDVKNIKSALLRTAVAVDTDTRNSITGLIRKKFNCEVELQEEIDAGLIGGFVLKIGDYQFDTSVLSGLNHLRKQFQENVYKKEF